MSGFPIDRFKEVLNETYSQNGLCPDCLNFKMYCNCEGKEIMNKICETCDGTGKVKKPGPPAPWGASQAVCSRCKGVGKVLDPMNGMIKDDRPVLFISRDELLNGPIEDRPEYQDNLSAVRQVLESGSTDFEARAQAIAILDGES